MAEDEQGLEGTRTSSDYSPNWDSGLRALCGIVAYYQDTVVPEYLADQLTLTGPASEDDLLRGARMLGLKANVRANMTARHLAQCPMPAMVCLADGRYRVLCGQDEIDDWILIDPITRVNSSVTVQQHRTPTEAPLPFERYDLWTALQHLRTFILYTLIICPGFLILAQVSPSFAQEVLDWMLVHHSFPVLGALLLWLAWLKIRG